MRVREIPIVRSKTFFFALVTTQRVGAPNLRPEKIYRSTSRPARDPFALRSYDLRAAMRANESDEDETNDPNVEAWPQWPMYA